MGIFGETRWQILGTAKQKAKTLINFARAINAWHPGLCFANEKRNNEMLLIEN
jgi:hypothetical protein